MNTAKFSVDNTAAQGYRMDYSGGLNQNAFYLKNGVFFNGYTVPDSVFTRRQTNDKPNFDTNKLP